jgi:hypothetical protein
MTHGEEHEALLEGLVLGERRAESEEIRALLAGCETCRSSWKALLPLTRSLARADRERAEVLAAAGRAAVPSLEAQALLALEEQWKREGLRAAPAKRTPGRAWRSWMLVAAAIAAMLVVWRPWSGADGAGDRRRVWLGDQDTRGFAPSGDVDRSGRFSWPAGLIGAQGGTLRIQWRRAEEWQDGPSIALAAFATEGSAPPELLAGLDGPLRWRLEWEDASGEPRSSDWVSFSR